MTSAEHQKWIEHELLTLSQAFVARNLPEEAFAVRRMAAHVRAVHARISDMEDTIVYVPPQEPARVVDLRHALYVVEGGRA